MKKITLAIVLILLATLLLTACNEDVPSADSADTTTPVADADSTTPAADVTPTLADNILAENGESRFSIIRSEYSEDMLTDASVDLKNAIQKKFDATLAIGTDWEKGLARDEYIETDTYEILIGKTNRVESKIVLDTLAENEYAIKWVSKKLVIVGSDDYATSNAVASFIDDYVKSATGEQLVIPADINVSGKASIQKIALAEGAELRVMTFNVLSGASDYGEGRKEIIMSTILDYLPDVIGFQESNKNCLNTLHLSETISKYYGINEKYHTGTTTANYTPILYLKSKYKQIEGGVEWNNSRYTKTNTKSLSWSVLERLSDGQKFIVVNIHGSLWLDSYTLPAGETLASIKSKAGNEWKVDNANQILAKIAELRERHGNIPAITTGDYNFNKTHAAYKTMQSTGLVSAQDDAKSATTSHASYHNSVGASPKAGGLAIDHIFYSADSVEGIKHVICMRKSDLQASDHCPVYCDIAFK